MTQGQSAVFPFLKLWKKTFSPLPSRHFEQTQRNNMNCKMFFSHVIFCYWQVKPLSQEMLAIQRWRLMISGQKWSLQAEFPYWTRLLHHVYHNSQARLRLHSWAPSLPAPLFYTFCFLTFISPDFTGHIVCLWIHLLVLTQSILSSSSFVFLNKTTRNVLQLIPAFP